MTINGKIVEHKAITLQEYLQHNGYRLDYIVVERSGEIITKERFGEVMLGEQDDINILQFMGGG